MKNVLKRIAMDENQITISNFLTLIRIILTPVICSTMMMQQWNLAWSLFIIAAATDLLDGFLARFLDQQTFLGACLDPIADKFLVLSVFFTLAFVRSALFSVPLWFVCIVLCKDMLLIIGTILLYCIQGFIEIRPTMLGKTTTCIQMMFIAWVFACYFFHWLPIKTYYCMLGIMLILVIGCLVQYMHQGLPMVTRFIKSLLIKDI